MQIFNRYIKEEATGKNLAQINSAVCSDTAENRLCTLQLLCGICSAILFPKGCIQCSYISLFRKGIQCVLWNKCSSKSKHCECELLLRIPRNKNTNQLQ